MRLSLVGSTTWLDGFHPTISRPVYSHRSFWSLKQGHCLKRMHLSCDYSDSLRLQTITWKGCILNPFIWINQVRHIHSLGPMSSSMNFVWKSSVEALDLTIGIPLFVWLTFIRVNTCHSRSRQASHLREMPRPWALHTVPFAALHQLTLSRLAGHVTGHGPQWNGGCCGLSTYRGMHKPRWTPAFISASRNSCPLLLWRYHFHMLSRISRTVSAGFQASLSSCKTGFIALHLLTNNGQGGLD